MKTDSHGHHNEVRKAVAAIKGPIPAHRALSKKGFSFSKLPFEEQLQIWDHVWIDGSFMEQIQAFFFLEQHSRREDELKAMWPVIKHWQLHVDDWGTCDSLAKVYTKILEVLPAEVYAQLAAWNKDGNPWCRRQSLVSLLYYARTKNVYLRPAQITALITPSLTDKEYYVQKGLGWTLRELYSVYPREAMAYLEEHLLQISAIAFTISAEKLGKEEKEKLKLRRRVKA